MILEKSRIQNFMNLENYLDSDQGKPIKTLREGDVFKLEDYPKGTIVRFGIDVDEPRWPWGRRLRQSEESWGVITQFNWAGKYYDLLVGWSFDEDNEVDPYNPEHKYTNFRFPIIVVGETIHTRIVEPTIDYVKRLLGSNKWQYFSRFNWVEIWKFGIEVREVEKAQQPAELSPQLQEIPRQV